MELPGIPGISKISATVIFSGWMLTKFNDFELNYECAPIV